jgi:hypothetical protein
MTNRRPRRGVSSSVARRTKVATRNASNGESMARAELKMMREVVVVLVQAIADLFASLPKDLYATEKVARIETKLAEINASLAERRQRWATEDDGRGFPSS